MSLSQCCTYCIWHRPKTNSVTNVHTRTQTYIHMQYEVRSSNAEAFSQIDTPTSFSTCNCCFEGGCKPFL